MSARSRHPHAPPSQVVVVGAASRDLTPDDPRGWRLGGGVTYGALALARLGLNVCALVGVDARAARARELAEMRAAGVDLRLVPLEHGPVFDLVESPGGRIVILHEASDAIPATACPTSWCEADALLLAPVADEIPDEWALVPRPGAIVAVGWQGMLRDLRPAAAIERRGPIGRAVLSRADLVGVSREDLAPSITLEGLAVPVRLGAQILLTDGERGGSVVSGGPVSAGGGRVLLTWDAIDSEAHVDATGAGDVFLAALLSARLDGHRLLGAPSANGDELTVLGRELRFAAAAASLAVEGEGLVGVADLEAVKRRFAGQDSA